MTNEAKKKIVTHIKSFSPTVPIWDSYDRRDYESVNEKCLS